MKTLKDLNINKLDKLKIERWLDEWLTMLIKNADGREGTVYRADFENNDFFYFTDCNDILGDDPEARGFENNRKIQIRKRVVMSQLLIKNLLGRTDFLKIKCSHCGYPDRWIDAIGDGFGHFIFCPKCQYTTIGSYPGGYATCIPNITRKLRLKYGSVKEIRTALENMPFVPILPVPGSLEKKDSSIVDLWLECYKNNSSDHCTCCTTCNTVDDLTAIIREFVGCEKGSVVDEQITKFVKKKCNSKK